MDKGQKVLFAMYKGKPSDEVKVSAEDLAVAKAEGYLFDYPKYESHADTLERLKARLRRSIRRLSPTPFFSACQHAGLNTVPPSAAITLQRRSPRMSS